MKFLFFDKYSLELGFKDLFYGVLIIVILLAVNSNFSSKKEEIETRLREVCFRYNDSCDAEMGGCECIARANDNDVMYILSK